jgi:beta-galactosidase
VLEPANHSLWGGAGAIELRSYSPGAQRIRATAAGLAPAEVVVVATGPEKAPRERRLPPPAPSVAAPPYGTGRPGGQGATSLAAYRPVAASSAEPPHEGGNATTPGNGAFWRAAHRDPGEWLTANLEFPYDITRIEVVFAEPPAQPWTVETSPDGRAYELLHRAEPAPESLEAVLEFPFRAARRVRLFFPEQPIDVAEIRVY